MTNTDQFLDKGTELPRQEKTSSVIHGSGGHPIKVVLFGLFWISPPHFKKKRFILGRAEWEAEADRSLWAGGFGSPRAVDPGYELPNMVMNCLIRVPGTELCSLNKKDGFLSTEVSLGVFWGVGGLVVLRLCSCTPGWHQTHHVTRDDPSVSIFQVMGRQACTTTPESRRRCHVPSHPPPQPLED